MFRSKVYGLKLFCCFCLDCISKYSVKSIIRLARLNYSVLAKKISARNPKERRNE